MIDSSRAPRLHEPEPLAVTGGPILEARGLGKRFEGRAGPVEALSDVSLSIGRGELAAVLGPSGCGKSTLLDILAGLERPTRGAVLIGGEDVTGRVGRVGYMPQKDLLLPWRTVLDNVILGLEVSGVPRGRAREEARCRLPLFDLEEFAGHYPAALSGGMRQRAALLRTFLIGREILVLDEPFGALDALTRAGMQEWLMGVQEEFHATVLLVTHDVDEAIYLADRVHVMSPRPGTLRATVEVNLPRPRRHDEIVTSPRFVELKRRVLATLREGVEGR